MPVDKAKLVVRDYFVFIGMEKNVVVNLGFVDLADGWCKVNGPVAGNCFEWLIFLGDEEYFSFFPSFGEVNVLNNESIQAIVENYCLGSNYVHGEVFEKYRWDVVQSR